MSETDPFENTKKLVAGLESDLASEVAGFEEFSKRLHCEMAERPGSEGSYREAIGYAYQRVVEKRRELQYWRTKLPPFAEARDGYIIMLLPVTPENEYLLRQPYTPEPSQPLPS